MPNIRVAGVLDVGTHSSGGGWIPLDGSSRLHPERDVVTWTQWPGQPVAYPKTLTALWLDEEGKVLAWGHEARRLASEHPVGSPEVSRRYIRHFKMALAAEPDQTGSFSLDDRVGSVEHYLGLYVRELYRFMLERMADAGYDQDDIRWCVTVPAIWNDYQKQAMRRACVAAGMPVEDGRFMLALEPEAAAHHVRTASLKLPGDADGRLNLPGARFMVADCGGGTIDISAYQGNDKGQIIEIGKVSGAKKGSQYLNEAFVECVLIKRLGGVEELRKVQRKAPAALEELLEHWERLKLHCRVDQADALILRLNAGFVRALSRQAVRHLQDIQDGERDHLIISADEVRDIFEQVVPPILRLVDEQLDEMTAFAGAATGRELVVVVGGFAASPYLRQRLRNHLAGRADVLVPPNPEVAVLSGAAQFAYAPQIRSRRSKYTYGIGSSQRFDPARHREEYKFTLSDGLPRCDNIFSRFVKAGESVETDKVLAQNYYPLEGTQRKIDVEFFTSTDDEVSYITEESCRKVGELKVDLRPTMHLSLEQRGIEVRMMFGETEVRSEVRLIATGAVQEHRLVFEEYE